MADAGGRSFGEREVAALDLQGDMYQENEYRDFLAWGGYIIRMSPTAMGMYAAVTKLFRAISNYSSRDSGRVSTKALI